MGAVAIDLTAVHLGAAGITSWAYKKTATAALTALRERGRNVERCIDIHPASNRFGRFWVVARPDDDAAFTWIMRCDGSWVRGRLYDGYLDTPARWEYLPAREPIPATVTHDYWYSGGTVGVSHNGKPLVTYGLNGRVYEVTGWLSSAYCVACTWSWHGSDEASVRNVGRSHRNNPGDHPLKEVLSK